MKEQKTDPKEPFKSIFLHQKKKFEKSLKFYKTLEQNIPAEESWKIQKPSFLHHDLNQLCPNAVLFPSQILERAIQTMDEYIAAIDSFTPDQFAAFLLGLGIDWLPAKYWGIQETVDYYAKIQKAIAFYEKLEAGIPEEEHWKIEKRSPFGESFTELVPPDHVKPTEVLEKARELVESMFRVLADRPF